MDETVGDKFSHEDTDQVNKATRISLIAVKDVIKCMATKRCRSTENVSDDDFSRRDRSLILIGCANNLNIYDPVDGCNLANVRLNGPIEIIAEDGSSQGSSSAAGKMSVCTGLHKIHAFRLELHLMTGAKLGIEESCERSSDDTITCIVWGHAKLFDLVVTGSRERNIRFYPIDSFDQNIQQCLLNVTESSPVVCICPIYILSNQSVAENSKNCGSFPEVHEEKSGETNPDSEEMAFIAYGLENGNLGVYRIFSNPSKNLSAERLWCLRCRQSPQTIIMYDINGDGLDELIVGYSSGRLEARSPFTGQLLAATRCFKSDRLVGLNLIDHLQDGQRSLFACSSSGCLIGFRPEQTHKRVPLRGYLNEVKSDLMVQSHDEQTMMEVFSMLKPPADDSDKQLATTDAEDAVDLNRESYDLYGNVESRCEIGQNSSDLQAIGELQKEQYELRIKICECYQTSLNRVSKSSLNDVIIRYSWSFDIARVITNQLTTGEL